MERAWVLSEKAVWKPCGTVSRNTRQARGQWNLVRVCLRAAEGGAATIDRPSSKLLRSPTKGACDPYGGKHAVGSRETWDKLTYRKP